MKKLRNDNHDLGQLLPLVCVKFLACVCGAGGGVLFSFAITLSVQHGTMNSTCFHYIPVNHTTSRYIRIQGEGEEGGEDAGSAPVSLAMQHQL